MYNCSLYSVEKAFCYSIVIVLQKYALFLDWQEIIRFSTFLKNE